ncbi:MAG TPA: hypothetical protein VK722_22645 [Candidatus Aquilonibacter sp.]|jgi:hypothetical protein|nr:hypothetical protein [Candidatus Aquilonibacter sp.]
MQSATETYALIRQAILAKDILAVSYRGSVREMCPHVLGKTKEASYALMYQFAGESKAGLKQDGSPDNWRCLRIEELSHVAVRKANGEWHTASNYSVMQNCVTEIDVQVETKAT